MSAQLATAIARLDSDEGLGAWAWLVGDRRLLPSIERAAEAEGAGVVAAGLAPLDDAEARLAQWLVLRYAASGILEDGPTPLSPPADAALRSLQRLLWRGWLRSPPVGGP